MTTLGASSRPPRAPRPPRGSRRPDQPPTAEAAGRSGSRSPSRATPRPRLPTSTPSRHATFACDNAARRARAGTSNAGAADGGEILRSRAEKAHPPVKFTQARSANAIESVEIRDQKQIFHRSTEIARQTQMRRSAAALAGWADALLGSVAAHVSDPRGSRPLTTPLSSPNYSPARTSTVPIPRIPPFLGPLEHPTSEPLDLRSRSLDGRRHVIRCAAPCRS